VHARVMSRAEKSDADVTPSVMTKKSKIQELACQFSDALPHAFSIFRTATTLLSNGMQAPFS